MSSTAMGDKLESQVYHLISDEIAHDRFFLKKEHCKVFKKKGYYSKDRKKDIVFDVSIEASLPGQEIYSVLVLIECKNYRHPVPVDDVEEFFAKIQQISGANIKGIIAATSSFQKGTVDFSRSKGIGLLRYFSYTNFKWELTRSPSAMVSAPFAQDGWEEALKGLSIENYKSRYFDCYAYSSGKFTNSLKLFFLNLVHEKTSSEFKSQLAPIINPISDNRRQVPYRDESEIEEKADAILRKVNYVDGEVSMDDVCAFQSAESGLSVQYLDADSSNSAILGKIRFRPLEITIFQSEDLTEERQRFTLAHELGHLLMGHSEHMAGEYCEATDFEFEDPIDLGVKEIMRMEWQANHFASCLLLPRDPFLTDFYRAVDTFAIKDRGFGVIYLDRQWININAFLRVTNVLTKKYKASRTVVKIRLKKLGLLNEVI